MQQNKENNKPIKTSPDIFIILKWIPNDNFQIPIIFQTPLIAELGHYQFPLALEINFQDFTILKKIKNRLSLGKMNQKIKQIDIS